MDKVVFQKRGSDSFVLSVLISLLAISFFVLLLSSCKPQLSEVEESFEWDLSTKPYPKEVQVGTPITLYVKVQSKSITKDMTWYASYFGEKGSGMLWSGSYDKNPPLAELGKSSFAPNKEYPINIGYTPEYDCDFVITYKPTTVGEHQVEVKIREGKEKESKVIRFSLTATKQPSSGTVTPGTVIGNDAVKIKTISGASLLDFNIDRNPLPVSVKKGEPVLIHCRFKDRSIVSKTKSYFFGIKNGRGITRVSSISSLASNLVPVGSDPNFIRKNAFPENSVTTFNAGYDKDSDSDFVISLLSDTSGETTYYMFVEDVASKKKQTFEVSIRTKDETYSKPLAAGISNLRGDDLFIFDLQKTPFPSLIGPYQFVYLFVKFNKYPAVAYFPNTPIRPEKLFFEANDKENGMLFFKMFTDVQKDKTYPFSFSSDHQPNISSISSSIQGGVQVAPDPITYAQSSDGVFVFAFAVKKPGHYTYTIKIQDTWTTKTQSFDFAMDVVNVQTNDRYPSSGNTGDPNVGGDGNSRPRR